MSAKPLIIRQRKILAATGYRTPDGSPDRLRRFAFYQPPLGKDLTPPVTADEAQAKDVSGPGRYPVFKDGRVERSEDSVREVVDELDVSVQRVMGQADITEAQADAIREELARFRDLAKAAYESAYRSQQLSDSAADLLDQSRESSPVLTATGAPTGESRGKAERRPIPPPTGEGEGKGVKKSRGRTKRKAKSREKAKRESERREPRVVPPPTPRDAVPRTSAPRIGATDASAEVRARQSVARAELAQAKAEEAQKAAVMAAKDAQEMRESLRRLNTMVKDAAPNRPRPSR